MNILEIKNLSLSFKSNQGVISVLENVNLSIEKDKTIGIVGESGSGKSITAMSILGLLPKNAIIDSGEILFSDGDQKINLIDLNEKELQKIRGKHISMIFQEPMTSLNPSVKCGIQVEEAIMQHTKISRREAHRKVIDLFDEVKLPDPERIFSSYPHEISGGQKQRVMIAMAISTNPKILIADEPSTALDVTVQKAIIELLKDIQSKFGISILFISHDLAVVSQIAHNVLVMYKGKVIESGTKNEILFNPSEAYTKGLMSCRPDTTKKQERLSTLSDYMNKTEKKSVVRKVRENNEVLLEIKSLSKKYITERNIWGVEKKANKAVDNINLKVFKGETLGLVGESGCGKTTLGRIIAKLIELSSGKVFYNGHSLGDLSKKELRKFRRKVQIIFQDPYSSLNPSKTIGNLLTEPLVVHNIGKNASERKQLVFDIFDKVKLNESSYYKYPHEFSGGQRQRIAIARALILKPDFIICDESVSALDISIQAEILNLLNDLKDEFNLTYIFISHDLSVVRYMSDRIMVMQNGKLIEINQAEIIYNSPSSDYTQRLIDSIPRITNN
ncbi:MAG: ABC transporter ATP-binding protein [Bacteroidales bacterium]|nr:ABC transporter ATP-binding protein [Bacteroidales bacterium]